VSVDPREAIRLPAGVRDFLPRAAARRRAIAERLLGGFEAWGYARIITPVFECADVLERGLGADARAAAIRFVEPGSGEVVALRPDITPQIARIVATRLRDVDGPIRLCYEGAVNRLPAPGGSPLAQREILQAGIELIDAGSPDGDAEALAVAAAALIGSGIADVRLDVGHAAPARWLFAQAVDPDARAALTVAIARKDRAATARAAQALPKAARALATALPGLWGPVEDVLARARALAWPKEVIAALAELEAILAAAAPLMDAALHRGITADLGEVRGFEYYTGARFAGYAAGAADAVVRGGRYDELIGRYGRTARATGFAVDIEAIAEAQRAAHLAPPTGAVAILIVPAAGDRVRASRLAVGLRATGARAAVDLGAARDPEAAIRYALAVGFDHVLTLDAQPHAIAIATRAERRIGAAEITAAIAGDGRALVAALTRSGSAR
jgi:ATP phosphoribosyltransferase regulatory subunit